MSKPIIADGKSHGSIIITEECIIRKNELGLINCMLPKMPQELVELHTKQESEIWYDKYNKNMIDKVKIELINGDTQFIPTRATKGSVGYDLRAELILSKKTDNILIPSGERKLIMTGIKLQIPKGYEVQVRTRSGMAIKFGLQVLNSPGTIDSDFRGEVGVILHNTDKYYDYTVYHGDRIAQMVINKVETPELIIGTVDETERQEGGFGSTGKQ